MTTASKLIKVTIRSNYGNEMAYPANDLGAMMCQLMGTKTFPDWGVNILRANGYKFEIVEPTRDTDSHIWRAAIGGIR